MTINPLTLINNFPYETAKVMPKSNEKLPNSNNNLEKKDGFSLLIPVAL